MVAGLGANVIECQSFPGAGGEPGNWAQLVYQPVQTAVQPVDNRLYQPAGIPGDTSTEAIRRVYAETGSLSEKTARRCFGYKDGYSFGQVKVAVGQS